MVLAGSARSPRLNPFAFPSDTDLRFALLIVSVVGASLFLHSLLFDRVLDYGKTLATRYDECTALAAAAQPSDLDRQLQSMGLRTDENRFARLTVRDQCLAPVQQRQAAAVLGGGLLVLLGGAAIYWVLPAFTVRRRGLRPLDATAAPELVAYVLALSHEAGLTHPPALVWNPLSRRSSPLVFGRFGRYQLAIPGGLVTEFTTNRATFRVKVLHELAHLRNADVDKTYLAVAMWWAFVLFGLVPELISLVWDGFTSGFESPTWELNLLVRLAALLALVLLSRNALLRAREFYADVRASVWEGELLAVLPSLQWTKSRWRALLSVHPDPVERERTIREPDRLLATHFWDVFVTGAAATVAYPHAVIIVSQLMTGTEPSVFATALMPIAIFSLLAAGVVGLQAWRSVFAARARGKSPGGVSTLALGLALGLVCGQFISLGSLPEHEAFGEFIRQTIAEKGLLGVTPLVVLNSIWFLIFVGSIFLFVAWITTSASTWLDVALEGHSVRAAYAVNLIAAGLLMTIWLGLLLHFWGQSEGLLLGGLGLGALSNTAITFAVMFFYSLSHEPLLVASLVAVWAFPLASLIFTTRTASPVEWAILDGSLEQLMLGTRSRLQSRLAVLSGITGGLVFAVVLLLVREQRTVLPDVVRSSFPAIQAFAYGSVLLGAIVQAGVAAYVVAHVRYLAILHGLMASFVGACCVATAILGLNLAFGGGIEPAFAWIVLSWTVVGGALLASVAGAVMWAIRNWTRSFVPIRGAAGQSVPAPAPHWRRWIAAGIDGFVVVTVIQTAWEATLALYRMLMSRDASVAAWAAYCLFVAWAFFTLFEGSALQATPGKLVCAIVVADSDGRRLSWLSAGLRSMLKVVLAPVLVVGYLVAAALGRHRPLHDVVLGSAVFVRPAAGAQTGPAGQLADATGLAGAEL